MTAVKSYSIPFNKPFIAGKELYYIAQAVMSGHLSGNGPFTKKCHQWLEKTLGCKKALLTHSCTGALEMAAILCDIQPGDEIIMPSFTFVSTANAFVLRGGVPIFVDIRPDTLNIDEKLIEAAITKRTKAIAPVHYAGVGCDMDRIMEIARQQNLYVIEDAAQGLLSQYKDRLLGTIGHLGCLSFHETKNIISGEGGAILINDERFVERAEIIWEKGTNRSKFFRGEVDKYTWVDIGSSYLPSELTAAFLFAQLEEAARINNIRSRAALLYRDLLTPLNDAGVLDLPCLPSETSSNGHMFYVLAKSTSEQAGLLAHLRKNEIYAVFHYVPLHTSAAGLRFGRISGELPVTVDVHQRLIRLPLYYGISENEIESIAKSIYAFYGR